MRILDLPPALLLFLFTDSVLSIPTATPTPVFEPRQAASPTTLGPSYASSCASAYSAYASSYSSWTEKYQYVSNQTQVLGGTSISDVTYYANATTLCDGHPRVTYSPAISLSTARTRVPHPATYTSVYQQTGFPNYPYSSPSCAIAPSDCDPLLEAYSTSLSAWQAQNASSVAGGTGPPRITAPPQTPPCLGQSQASSYAAATAEIYGCGLCTIFGQGVELVYFPTSVSRDMCASTPPASLTHYGSGAVITAYAGTEYGRNASSTVQGSQTAILGRNTFTSGTAYISIATVWAENRCSSTIGTPVSDAILVMPSESVLSLRYSQNHFQYFMSTDTQTGYPVSYADFNSPVPFSAWIGQARCEGPWDTWYCGVVYENDFRPQLAIPPEIRQLNPEWEGCQMWYGGLYDPPVALQVQESAAAPTRPHPVSDEGLGTTARPSQTAAAPTSAPTVLSQELGGGEDGIWAGGNGDARPTRPSNQGSGNDWQNSDQTGEGSACVSETDCSNGSEPSSSGEQSNPGESPDWQGSNGGGDSDGGGYSHVAPTTQLSPSSAAQQPNAGGNPSSQGLQSDISSEATPTTQLRSTENGIQGPSRPQTTGPATVDGQTIGDGGDSSSPAGSSDVASGSMITSGDSSDVFGGQTSSGAGAIDQSGSTTTFMGVQASNTDQSLSAALDSGFGSAPENPTVSIPMASQGSNGVDNGGSQTTVSVGQSADGDASTPVSSTQGADGVDNGSSQTASSAGQSAVGTSTPVSAAGEQQPNAGDSLKARSQQEWAGMLVVIEHGSKECRSQA
ncbi:hypothetical protein LTR42_010633 [Elasticomyces elasticus]|nr:hypothetical protein LTR42_010633 [Elasticomyces elasticus]